MSNKTTENISNGCVRDERRYFNVIFAFRNPTKMYCQMFRLLSENDRQNVCFTYDKANGDVPLLILSVACGAYGMFKSNNEI